MEKLTRKMVEGIFGSEDNVKSRLAKATEDLNELYAKRDSRSVSLVSHPMILAITIEGKPSFIVDQNTETNLRRFDEISAHLDVPRYTPDTAKLWLDEELVVNNNFLTPEEIKNTYGKKAIGEIELIALMIEDRESVVSSCNTALECFEKAVD